MDHDDTPAPDRPFAPPPARDGAPLPPTPVRASLGENPGEAPHEEAVGNTAELEVDGVGWTARLSGMSRSGAGQASATILLLRFERSGTADPTPRDAWVVGRSLSDLTDLHLEAALRRSRPVPGVWERKPLFPETGSRGGKDT